MSYYYNNIMIEGSMEDIQALRETNLDFKIIHLCPYPSGEERKNWIIKYWGCEGYVEDIDLGFTKINFDVVGSAEDILDHCLPMDYLPMDSVNISAYINTLANPPNTILTFLTKQYPSLRIINEWNHIDYETAGINMYSNGSMNCKYIEPWAYSDEVLEAFENNNKWFSYDDYYACWGEAFDEREEEDLLPVVEVITYTKTYEELIAE